MTQLKHHRIAVALAVGVLLGAPLAASAQKVQVEKMCACQVTGLSADGSAATGLLNANYATFRWTRDGGTKRLGRSTAAKLDGQTAGVPAISFDGKVIAATIMDDTNTYGTEGRWTVDGGWQQLGPMPPDGGILDSFDSGVFGMSGDGTTVTGLYWRPGQQGGSAHGSVWTAANGMVGLPTNGRSSRVDGANIDGTVLVGWEEDVTTGVRMAVVWDHGVKTFIDDGGGVGWPSEASAVNADGSIVVGQGVNVATQREEATMWKRTDTGWEKITLGVGPHTDATGSAYALAVSDDGSVVSGSYRTDFDTFSSGGFVWTERSGVKDAQAWLHAQGVSIRKAFVFQAPAMSRDGKVLAFVTQQNMPPFAIRSILVTRKKGGAME